MFQQGSASIYYYTVDADALYDYGDGSGPVHFSEFHCTGNETHLLNCSVDEDIAISVYCVNAGVRCPTGMLESEPHSSYHKSKKKFLSPEPCTESEVRLNNEVVQICHNQQWTPVCAQDGSFYDSDAEVVCNQVGIPSRR